LTHSAYPAAINVEKAIFKGEIYIAVENPSK